MSLPKLAVAVAALWCVPYIVGGITIGAGLPWPGPLATLLALAALVTAASGIANRLHGRLLRPMHGKNGSALVCAVGVVSVNGALFWAAAALAGLIGLRVEVDGALPALCASLVLPLASGVFVTAVSAGRAWVERTRRS